MARGWNTSWLVTEKLGVPCWKMEKLARKQGAKADELTSEVLSPDEDRNFNYILIAISNY